VSLAVGAYSLPFVIKRSSQMVLALLSLALSPPTPSVIVDAGPLHSVSRKRIRRFGACSCRSGLPPMRSRRASRRCRCEVRRGPQPIHATPDAVCVQFAFRRSAKAALRARPLPAGAPRLGAAPPSQPQAKATHALQALKEAERAHLRRRGRSAWGQHHEREARRWPRSHCGAAAHARGGQGEAAKGVQAQRRCL
jgi:hypothetical protein